MAKSGWVFRIEIVTKKPCTLTDEMKATIEKLLKESPLISEFLIEELFEDIKLFKKEEA